MAPLMLLLLVCVGLAGAPAPNAQLRQDSAGNIILTTDPPVEKRQLLLSNNPETMPENPGTTLDADNCLPGFALVAGVGCYQIGIGSLKYGYARSKCESADAHLAIPDSQGELDALQSLRAQYHVTEFWIGIHRINDSWQTIEGTPLANLNFPVWASGYPFTTVNCTYLKEDGLANYYPCDNALAYICEQP